MTEANTPPKTPRSSPHQGTPFGMLPHFTPRRFNCSIVVYVDSGALRTPAPIHSPGSCAAKGIHSHIRGDITVNQTNRLPLHILLVATGLLDRPSPHKLPPGKHPGLTAPKRKARSKNPAAVLASCGSSGFTLRASGLAAACRLRQSCRRDRGPVAYPRARHPVRRSRHPAALQ